MFIRMMPPAIDQCTFFLVLLLVGVSSGIEYSRIKVNHNIEITGQDKNRIVSENITMLIESHARITKHYHLPLDQVSKVFEIVNKFGLSATVVGNGQLVGGVKKNGFLLSETGGITISPGPVEVNECLFNLSYCTEGYSLSFFINFLDFPKSDMVYLTSGSHVSNKHGISLMVNKQETMFLTFRTSKGKEWRLQVHEKIRLNAWVHFFITWSEHYGLYFYIDGELVSQQSEPHQALASKETQTPQVMFGAVGDNYHGGSANQGVNFLIDEIHIWMNFKHEQEVLELGSRLVYRLPMNKIRELLTSSSSYADKLQIGGKPIFLKEGVTADALEFNGKVDFIMDDIRTYCFKNVSSCLYGFLLSTFIRFGEDSYEGGCYVYTGESGIKIYYHNKILYADVYAGYKTYTLQWRHRGAANHWRFVELSYYPPEGAQLFVDHNMVSKISYAKSDSVKRTTSDEIQIARLSPGLGHQAFALDDFELRYGDREILLNLGYINRGQPAHYYIAMDSIVDYRTIPHSNLTINVYNNPRVVPGKVKNAVNLDGNSQYIYIASQSHYHPCFMNLIFCGNGATLIFWIKPGKLASGTTFLSTGAFGFQMWQDENWTIVSASRRNVEFSLRTDRLVSDKWQLVELSYNPDPKSQNLQMFIDNQLVAETSVKAQPLVQSSLEGFYFGRDDGTRRGYLKYGNFTIDEVEYWMSNRDYLLKFNFIKRGVITDYIYLSMDEITRGNKLVHAFLDVNLINNPSLTYGKVNRAIRLNGNHQYMSLGNFRDTCFGNLALCQDGMNNAMWLNFKSFPLRGCIFSNGRGVQVYTEENQLLFVMEADDKIWKATVFNLKLDKWYFVEYTWNPQSGLQVYLNNRLVASTNRALPAAVLFDPESKVLIGTSNFGEGKECYGNLIIDEFQFWFQHRDQLIASKIISRENIQHIWFTFESQKGNLIYHPDFELQAHNGAQLTTEGAVGNGLLLSGTNEFVSFGDQRHVCMGNLALCSQGITISMLIKPHSLPNKGYILSGGPYSIYTDNGRVYAVFTHHNKTWTVSSNQLDMNRWQQLEFSWHADSGLEMFIDGRLIAEERKPTIQSYPAPIYDYNVYLGRSSLSRPGSPTTNASIDELHYWYASRDQLDLDLEFNNIILDMDFIMNNQLFNKYTTIDVEGGAKTVEAIKLLGVQLNGIRQYLEAADSHIICLGNLNNCQRGFTLRFKIRPDQIKDNQYLLSSSPLDIYFNNQRLHAEFRNNDQMWKVASSTLVPHQWYQVDLSWSPVDGASLYIDGQKVDSNVGRAYSGTYNSTKHFYVGRANTEMLREVYANAVFDDMQFWEANRNLLLYYKLINNEKIFINNTLLWSTIPPPSFVFPPHHNITNHQIIFDGLTWIAYDISKFPQEYRTRPSKEELSFLIRTDRPNGLIWHSGDQNSYISFFLEGGRLWYYIYDGKQGTAKQISGPNINLSDNRWHSILINRNDRRLVADVDGHVESMVDPGVSIMGPNIVHVGGAQDVSQHVDFRINDRFHGEMSKMTYRRDGKSDLHFKEYPFIHPQPDFLNVTGNWKFSKDEKLFIINFPPHTFYINSSVEKVVPSVNSSITFTDGTFSFVLPRWTPPKSADSEMSLQLKYLTTIANGVLLSATSRELPYFVIELYDGVPYLVANFGKGFQHIHFGSYPTKTNDNRVHYLKLSETSRSLQLTLDDDTLTLYYMQGQNMSLGLKDADIIISLGGPHLLVPVPWATWNGNSVKFIGCVLDVRLNAENALDLWELSQKGRFGRGGIVDKCKNGTDYCSKKNCHFGGVCHNLLDSHYCDCSDINYYGKNCESNSLNVMFNGTDKYTIKIVNPSRKHADEFSVRFKTLQKNAFLFSATNTVDNDFIKVTLDEGIGKVESKFGGAYEPTVSTFECEEPLNDNKWHTAHVKRRANYLEAYIDGCPTFKTYLPGENYEFLVDTVTVGREDDSSYFIGYIKNFYFNREHLFPSSSITAATEEELPISFHVITIRENSKAHLTYPSLNIVGNTKLQLMFKTTSPNGIILYNPGFSEDFLAVELVDGRLHVLADDETGVREVTSSAGVLSDGKWHLMEIEQASDNKFNVIVDKKYRDILEFVKSKHTLDLTGSLYIGGVPDNMLGKLNKQIKSRNGYSGCLASFVVNRIIYKLDDDDLLNAFITPGCSDAHGFCLPNICKHGGICTELQDKYLCNCDLTTFVGTKCTEESSGWEFGENDRKGIILYKFNPKISTNKDEIALAFHTYKKSGTLMKVNSTYNKDDYILIKLDDGFVVADFMIDGEKYIMRDDSRRYNDGKHHRVVFLREGNRVTMKVDDRDSHWEGKIAKSSAKFDDMTHVLLGGNLDDKNNIIDYFTGIISGVYINGVRIFDGQYTKIGVVGVATHPLRPSFPEPATPKVPDVSKATLPPYVKPTVPVVPDPDELEPPKPEAVVGVPPVYDPLVGPRAAVAAGTVLGVLLLASSAMWAFYKMKPGKFTPASSPKPQPVVGSPTEGPEKPSLLGYSITDGAEAHPLLPVNTAAVTANTLGMTASSNMGAASAGVNQSITYSYEHNQVFSQQGLPLEMSQSSTPGGHFSMRNVDLSYGGFNQQDIFTQQQQQRMLQQQQHLFNTSTLGQSSTMNRNLMAAEEIRVDCVQMTNNGRYVVTGSNCGPPQVWDLKSGELVKVMKGDEFSSTDLHLANGDTLLVGQVAELEPVDVVDANRVHQRRLQVWDFETGKPIEMSRTETCTASCMMSDGERMLLGRTDRFGGGTTIIIWDILANEPVRQIKCDSSVGFADHISYLNVTKDSRYVIAGFQNTYDGTANYVTFDLASADINASGMRVSSLDADVDVTTLLNDKEAVTGTRKGELIVWSVKTGKQLRSLGGGAMCHSGEVKDVVVSKDGQLLVSASTDGTIKVWDIDSESLLHTLTGHRDEVWCCTLSPDNELVGSGSKDGTIRLWKVSDGTSVAAIDAGMTVFKVLLSNNKKTVVALADKGGARKLIMLRVVRSTATIDRRNQIVRA